MMVWISSLDIPSKLQVTQKDLPENFQTAEFSVFFCGISGSNSHNNLISNGLYSSK
jgi:hypothetical protein